MAGFSFPSDLEGVRFHFVGIKGTGMTALAEILHARGAVITGSDVSERFYTDEIIERLGIRAIPFSEKNITSDLSFVVYSSAYSVDKNPDLIEAGRRGLPMLLYSEALGAISRASYSCGVCGVHGKTTTSGFCGTLLKELPLASQVLAGSVIKSFGDSCVMTKGHEFFVAETCEYQRHFMAFDPKKIILTSVESDHQDYYPSYEDIRQAFVDYICRLPEGGQVIYCADDKGACEAVGLARGRRPDIRAVPYGESADGDYRISFGRVEGGERYFEISILGECAIRVPGEHNVRNAAAAVALSCELLRTSLMDPKDYADALRKGLRSFAGGKRRSEVVAAAKTSAGQDVVFIDDYAHHPTAIKTTLAGLREFYRNHKIIVDFMSHTYTRTAALLEDFASSFGFADKVIINKIYGSAREDASAADVSGEGLAARAKKYHPDVHYAGEFDEAAELGLRFLSEPSGASFPDGYVFVTMGAGDNWKVGERILERLRGLALIV